MPIIPFILEGDRRTVADRRADFETAGGIEGGVVLIEGLDTQQFRSSRSSNISYDLHVGCEYRDHRDSGKKELGKTGKIDLFPGAAVIIESEEIVNFPRKIMGLIVPKVSLLQKGLSNTFSKVDPGYNGPLIVTVFNLGRKTVTLKRQDPFCSLSLVRVEEGAALYSLPGKRITGETTTGILLKTRDWLERNFALITVINVVGTLILTLTLIILYLLRNST